MVRLSELDGLFMQIFNCSVISCHILIISKFKMERKLFILKQLKYFKLTKNDLNNNIYVSVINIISIFIILVLAILCLFCSKLYNISGPDTINCFNDRENYKSSLVLGTTTTKKKARDFVQSYASLFEIFKRIFPKILESVNNKP